MTLQLQGYIALPEHLGTSGFDHVAFHRASQQLYAAHTANDAVDVIDGASGRYLRSIPNLNGVAGALVADADNLVFTSNRGENTVGIFSPHNEAGLAKVGVGVRPNGLAYAPPHKLLLAANVGDLAIPNSHTVSLVDVARRERVGEVPVPGRTRWTIYDAQQDVFFVNIADPALIVVIEAAQPTQVAKTFTIAGVGPHGLDLDTEQRRLFCACDGRKLITLDAGSGKLLAQSALSGVPDVIFFDAQLHRLYVAIGDPGLIDVFDTDSLTRVEVISTEAGAHTLGFDPDGHRVYAFLPQTHRAAIYTDTP
jgi:DNA-binding beta-propeller fold protein YncE